MPLPAANDAPPTIRVDGATPLREGDGSRRESTVSSSSTVSGTGDMNDYYGLRWLFDEDNPTHLPIEEKVLQFQQRDLRKTKLYKAATKIFWTPLSRKRVIIAGNGSGSGPVNRNTNVGCIASARPTPNEICSAPPMKRTEETVPDPLEYQTWIAERKWLRTTLDSMGLNEAYLSKKPDKTPLEMSVLRKIIDARRPKPKIPVIREDPPYNLKLGDNIPHFRRPCPEAIIVIEEFLSRNKMRLVDLFKNVDKKKKWTVTRGEFVEAVKKAGIPLSEMALEDLIVSLDVDMDNCIDYRELAKGMKDWKLQKKRDKQRLLAEPGGTASLSTITNKDQTIPRSQSPHTRSHSRASRLEPINKNVTDCDVTSECRAGTESPLIDPDRLTPPEVDMRTARMDLDCDESMVSLRKRNRETLRAQRGKKTTMLPKTNFHDGRSVIKIGNPAIDDHCCPSTLLGETGSRVDKFRQERLREYLKVLKICEEYDVPLSEKLITKVLLYPADKPHRRLRRNLRQPGGPLISINQFRQRKYDGTVTRLRGGHGSALGRDSRSKGGLGQHRGAPLPGLQSGSELEDGENDDDDDDDDKTNVNIKIIDDDSDDDYDESEEDYYQTLQGKFRPRRNRARKMYLSTGKAYISRKVDCWMTFEEYQRLMSKVDETMYKNGPSDDSAFWPGEMLDRLRLCMPQDAERRSQHTANGSSIFQHVARTPKRAYPGYNNDLNVWPVNGRYLMQGHHNPYKNKYC